MSTYKAYRLHSYDGPQALRLDDLETPTPGPSQVRVAVSKAAVNPFDWKVAEGYVKDHLPLQLPATIGVDFVGTIAAIGAGSSRFAIGDRVMTMSTSLGAFAEQIVVNEDILARVPEGLSDEAASTLPIPGLTAWQSLYTAGAIHPGMRVLIHGASGVVGALAVQFAKAAGAEVIATASAKNHDFVMSLGADKFIDYNNERFEDHAEDVDLVLDFVLVGGANNTTNRSWGVLKPQGAIVSVADPSILGSVPAGFRGFFPVIEPQARRLEAIAEQLRSGKIQTKIAKVFPRDQLVEAITINKAGGTAGRLIVNFLEK